MTKKKTKKIIGGLALLTLLTSCAPIFNQEEINYHKDKGIDYYFKGEKEVVVKDGYEVKKENSYERTKIEK